MKKNVANLFIVLIILSIALYEYAGINFALQQVNHYQWLFQIIGIGLIAMTVVIAMFMYNKKSKINVSHALSSLLLVIFLVISSLNYLDVIQIPQQETFPNLYNMNVQDVKEWAKEKNIEVIERYENSDIIEKYHVFSQNVVAGSMLDHIKTVEIVVSDGPNYDKSLIIPQMLGWNVDEVKEYMNSNFLNNVNISFEQSEEEEYVVIKQDKFGKMFRRDEIRLVFSIHKDQAKEVAMIDLKNMTAFDATLWLMMNQIPYELKYDFNEAIERNSVISQNINVGEIVNMNSKVELTISKGKEIVVGNLLNMSVEEVTQWVILNNLDINFSDAYDDTVPLGSIIKANYKEGDIIEEGTLIELVTSKGQLKMEEFSSLASFKSWANTYGIKYKTNYQFSDSISRSKIISFSHKVGDIIKNGETITVTISKGKAVSVPNFVGMSKSAITSKCNSLNLSCSFSYGNYGSKEKDTATSQSVSSGSKVEIGTGVSIVLSRGPAKSYTLYFSNALLGNSYSASVSSLKNYLGNNYPGVTFKYVAKSHASLAPGNIHEDSPTKPGMTVTQGKTYTIYIVK